MRECNENDQQGHIKRQPRTQVLFSSPAIIREPGYEATQAAARGHAATSVWGKMLVVTKNRPHSGNAKSCLKIDLTLAMPNRVIMTDRIIRIEGKKTSSDGTEF